MAANTLSFARALVTTNLKAALALRSAFVIQVVFMALNNLTFFVFWWALMKRVTTIRGWQLADIQMLFGLVAASFGLTVTLARRSTPRAFHRGWRPRYAADAPEISSRSGARHADPAVRFR